MRRGGARIVRAARHRARSLGLVGKTGVGVMGGAPLVGSALDAGSKALSQMKALRLSLMSTANVAFWEFLNGLSVGFGGGKLTSSAPAFNQDGEFLQVNVDTGVPSGAWWKTTFVGGLLVAFDIGISWAARKLAKVNSGVRFLGSKLTGGK